MANVDAKGTFSEAAPESALSGRRASSWADIAQDVAFAGNMDRLCCRISLRVGRKPYEVVSQGALV
ncbi:MAG: hypothetical protein ABSD11_17110 [Methylocella sp.]|jgi:hypothetical protein